MDALVTIDGWTMSVRTLHTQTLMYPDTGEVSSPYTIIMAPKALRELLICYSKLIEHRFTGGQPSGSDLRSKLNI